MHTLLQVTFSVLVSQSSLELPPFYVQHSTDELDKMNVRNDWIDAFLQKYECEHTNGQHIDHTSAMITLNPTKTRLLGSKIENHRQLECTLWKWFNTLSSNPEFQNIQCRKSEHDPCSNPMSNNQLNPTRRRQQSLSPQTVFGYANMMQNHENFQINSKNEVEDEIEDKNKDKESVDPIFEEVDEERKKIGLPSWMSQATHVSNDWEPTNNRAQGTWSDWAQKVSIGRQIYRSSPSIRRRVMSSSEHAQIEDGDKGKDDNSETNHGVSSWLSMSSFGPGSSGSGFGLDVIPWWIALVVIGLAASVIGCVVYCTKKQRVRRHHINRYYSDDDSENGRSIQVMIV